MQLLLNSKQCLFIKMKRMKHGSFPIMFGSFFVLCPKMGHSTQKVWDVDHVVQKSSNNGKSENTNG
jgi:hypothetical protein